MTTYQGTVTASSGWNAPVERKRIEPGPPESYEALFHEVGEPAFLLMLRQPHAATEEIGTPRFHREIGAIYKPEKGGLAELMVSPLAAHFDVLIHLDETTALEPLDRTLGWSSSGPAPPSPTGA
jgi:erythromycin esterase-like protein